LEGDGVYSLSAGGTVLGAESFSDTETGVVYGGRLGVVCKIRDQIVLDFGYTELRSTVAYENDGFAYDMKVSGHSFTAGVAFLF
jgi:opacity protein-like surface antigen